MRVCPRDEVNSIDGEPLVEHMVPVVEEMVPIEVLNPDRVDAMGKDVSYNVMARGNTAAISALFTPLAPWVSSHLPLAYIFRSHSPVQHPNL